MICCCCKEFGDGNSGERLGGNILYSMTRLYLTFTTQSIAIPTILKSPPTPTFEMRQ